MDNWLKMADINHTFRLTNNIQSKKEKKAIGAEYNFNNI